MFKLRLLTAAAAAAFLAGAATAQTAPQSAQPADDPNQPMESATPPASATQAPASATAAPTRHQQSAAATPEISGQAPTSKEGMSESTTRAWVDMDLQETTVGNSRLFVGTITDSAGKSLQIVTNGPVPDNAHNRAEFPPLSNAGRRTAARGN